ncbi:tape measure protein [Latilactobacillus phage TMW 1.706 P2]|nr:tape measure protein [Latilactobacillus phage TMW 1.706 P2]
MDLAASLGLVKVASAAFGFVTSGLGEIVKGLNESSATWKTFEGNMKGFGKSGAEIAKVKKELQSYAQATIYSASDMASTYAQLSAVGTKNTTKLVEGFGGLAAAAEDPQQAMKSLSQQATQMAARPQVAWEDFKIMLEQTPAGMAAVAKEMGMSLTDLVKKVQDGSVKTDDFFNAIAKAGTNDTFGKMATQFKTVGQAADGLKETITNKLQGAFDKMGQVGINAIVKLTDWIQTINFDAIIASAVKFGTDVYNSIMKVVSYVQQNSDWLGPIAAGIAAGVTAFMAINGAIRIATTTMAIFNAVMSINPFVALIVGITAVVAGLVYFFTQTESGKEIWANFTAFLTQTWQATVAVAQTIWTALATFFSGLWTGITTFATAIWTSLVASLGGIWNGLVTYASGVFNLLKAVIMGPILLLVDLVTGNFDQMKSDAILIWNSIKAAAGQIWNGLSAMVSGIVSNFVSSVSGLFRAMAGLVVGIWNGLKAMVVGIAQGIASGAISAWNGMVSGVRGIISSVRSTFNSLRDINLFSIGKHIVQGLVNGIGGMIGNVRDKISELASTVTSGIRKALKIHSPSRVMAELGMYTGMGFSNGIEEMIPTAEKMSKKLAEAAMIKKTFGVNSEFAGITAESATGIGRGVTPTNSVVNNYSNVATTTVQTAKESNNKVLEALNKIANNRPVAVVDGSSFAPAYEQYGSTETARRSQMKGRGLAVDSKF